MVRRQIMTVLLILAITLSISAIALSISAIAMCVRVDSVHADNMRRVVKYIETLDQRIKTLEKEVKKRENNG